MPTVQLRPTFLLPTELDCRQTMRCVKSAIGQSPNNYQGQFTDQHAMISIVGAQRHFWSPWLQLEYRDNDQQHWVFGRFSPHPSIWTAFMFSYLAIGVLMFFAAMFGVSQQLSNQPPWAYLVIPIGLVIGMMLWFASQAGQRLAHAEMEELRTKIENCLRDQIDK